MLYLAVLVFPVGSHGKEAEFSPERLQDFSPFFLLTPIHLAIQKYTF